MGLPLIAREKGELTRRRKMPSCGRLRWLVLQGREPVAEHGQLGALGGREGSLPLGSQMQASRRQRSFLLT